MTCYASVLVTIPGALTFDEADAFVAKVRESAEPFVTGRQVLIKWEAPDLWQLRGLVEETVVETEWAFDIWPEREPAGGYNETNLARFSWWVGPIEPPVAQHAPPRDIGYTFYECDRDMRALTKGERGCGSPEEHMP